MVGITKSKRSPRPRVENNDPTLYSVPDDDPEGVKLSSGGRI